MAIYRHKISVPAERPMRTEQITPLARQEKGWSLTALQMSKGDPSKSTKYKFTKCINFDI